MTEKRFECDNPLDYRGYGVFDLLKADKTMDDFRDEDGICSYEFHNYLVDETDAMMTGGEVVDLLNKLNDENEQLKSNINIRDECIIEFQEENESLKQSLANKMDSDAWWEKKAKQRVLELEKENEQLKKIIKDHLEYNPILDELGLLE